VSQPEGCRELKNPKAGLAFLGFLAVFGLFFEMQSVALNLPPR
jgi:hypothetical protein